MKLVRHLGAAAVALPLVLGGACGTVQPNTVDARCSEPVVWPSTVQASCSNLEAHNWRARIQYWDGAMWRRSPWENGDGDMLVVGRAGDPSHLSVVVGFDTDHPSY